MAQGRELALGETGTIEITIQRKVDGTWRTVPRWKAGDRARARVRQRGFDGRIRDISRVAPTKVEARTALERALAGEQGAGTGLAGSTRLHEALTIYLEDMARVDGLAEDSVRLYTGTAKRYVYDSTISELRLDQLTPHNLRRFLQGVADCKGTSSAKAARSVVAGTIRRAIADGALSSNPLMVIGPVQGEVKAGANKNGKRTKELRRALTREERDAIRDFADEFAREEGIPERTRLARQALADQVAILCGTGMRINESRTMVWDNVHITGEHAESPWAYIGGTKSTASKRSVTLPPWLVERLSAMPVKEGLVIPSPTDSDRDTPWDQANNAHAIRRLLDAAGFSWAVSHTFRRTVATLANKSGVPVNEIADQLGHANPAMTMSAYLGRDAMGSRPDLSKAL